MDKIVPVLIVGLVVAVFTMWTDVQSLNEHKEKAPTRAEMAVLESKVAALETSTAAGIKRIEDRVNDIYGILISQ